MANMRRLAGTVLVIVLTVSALVLASCGSSTAGPESFLSPEDAEILAELERVYADLKDGGTIFFGQQGSLENENPDDIWDYMDMCGAPIVKLLIDNSSGEATDLQEQISAMPQVTSCIYESSAEYLNMALEMLEGQYPPDVLEKVTENFQRNPYPNSLSVTLTSSRHIPEFVALFQDNPEVVDVSSSLDLEGFLAFLTWATGAADALER